MGEEILRTGGVITQLFDAIEFSVVHERSTSYLKRLFNYTYIYSEGWFSGSLHREPTSTVEKSPNNFLISQQHTSTTSLKASKENI
ncbi:hypothetical protein Smp_149340 [Schistosoma mansoni]|uniref:hypothetical protein n=1 Tax=Schistosoma mansoni TaxID=6183 RepID=UPI0001A63F07|nr:hypothetical protein Smp_149340 [Schistosoma mansoni]|eukprot:XP_018653289.1 hypothetical protein Smp_149340 [Schistosoma mansoni]